VINYGTEVNDEAECKTPDDMAESVDGGSNASESVVIGGESGDNWDNTAESVDGQGNVDASSDSESDSTISSLQQEQPEETGDIRPNPLILDYLYGGAALKVWGQTSSFFPTTRKPREKPAKVQWSHKWMVHTDKDYTMLNRKRDHHSDEFDENHSHGHQTMTWQWHGPHTSGRMSDEQVDKIMLTFATLLGRVFRLKQERNTHQCVLDWVNTNYW
jgi:hypothetical protein